MSIRQEPGFVGNLISLGGVRGNRDRGRQASSEVITLNGNEQIAFTSNSRRIAALIQNSKASALRITVFLGEYLTGGTEQCAHLDPGESFQIDYQFPWTGSVSIGCTGAANVYCTEISVP